MAAFVCYDVSASGRGIVVVAVGGRKVLLPVDATRGHGWWGWLHGRLGEGYGASTPPRLRLRSALLTVGQVDVKQLRLQN